MLYVELKSKKKKNVKFIVVVDKREKIKLNVHTKKYIEFLLVIHNISLKHFRFSISLFRFYFLNFFEFTFVFRHFYLCP